MKLLSNPRRPGRVLLLIAGGGALLSVAAASVRPSNIACVNNAAALSLAITQYVQDNDERFPPTRDVPGFQAAVLPYAHTTGVFTCPATGVAYRPNPALDRAFLYSQGQDLGRVEVFRDGQTHADGLATVAFGDAHIERGGIDQADPEQKCVNDAKRLGLALDQYVQDNDEVLPPLHTPLEMQNALLPYAGSTRYFRSPVTGLPFTPDPGLSGRPLSAFPDPSGTEALRDPRRHRDGRSVIVYVDGHVARQ